MFDPVLSFADVAADGLAKNLRRYCRVRFIIDDEPESYYGTLEAAIRELRRVGLLPRDRVLGIEFVSVGCLEAFFAAGRLAGFPDIGDESCLTTEEIARTTRISDSIRNGTRTLVEAYAALSADDEPFTNAEFDAE